MSKITTRSDASNRKSPPANIVIGIDLGTTNSLLALAGATDQGYYLPAPDEGGRSVPTSNSTVSVELIKLPQQNLDGTVAEHVLFPSVVFQEAGNLTRFVGMGAKEAKFRFRRGRQVFYSVKRDLGTDREPFYPGASTPELDTPVKVSAVILKAMKVAAEAKLGFSLEGVPVVITIPASFQSAQRSDTLRAARLAGFNVGEDRLFDEPNAALLAYINRRRVQARWNAEETVLVFDFGGGTCDISIIDVSVAPVRQTINLKNLAISRYEQLGGDDIDQHIVHSHLADIFYRTSGRKERDWGLGERRNSIWSQLAKIAELLKVRYCEELEKVTQSQQWNAVGVNGVMISLPPQLVSTSQGDVELVNLSMTWGVFAKVMEPFLKPDCSLNADREYYRLTSIFTPVVDALEKANLKPRDITRILLVGGSSRNPLVEKAIQDFFSEATVDCPSDMDFLVAEGAAVHAYWKFVKGHDVLSPILGDTIGLLTEGDVFVPLMRAGAPIPFPSDAQWLTYTQFRVPRNFMSHVDLVLCAGSASRPVHTVKLSFSQVVPANAPVHLKVRLDGNKVLHFEAFLPEYPNIHISESIENPLSMLPLTSAEKRRAEIEKVLSKAQADGALDQHTDEMVELADILQKSGKSESALEWINQAARRVGPNSDDLKSRQALFHYQLGEMEAAHKIWVELTKKRPNQAVWAFNAGISAPDLATRENYVRRALAIEPGYGIGYYGLGVTLRLKGDHAGARRALESAESLLEEQLIHWPDSEVVRSYLISTYEELGKPQKANELRQRTTTTGKSTKPESNLVAITNAIIPR